MCSHMWTLRTIIFQWRETNPGITRTVYTTTCQEVMTLTWIWPLEVTTRWSMTPLQPGPPGCLPDLPQTKVSLSSHLSNTCTQFMVLVSILQQFPNRWFYIYTVVNCCLILCKSFSSFVFIFERGGGVLWYSISVFNLIFSLNKAMCLKELEGNSFISCNVG